MNEESSSQYWRKILEIDAPASDDSREKHLSWHRALRPLFYRLIGLPLKFYCPAEVRGAENIPPPPYIIAANHGSSMDYTLIAWAMGERREELHPLATKLFYDIPFTRFWIKVAANAVRIDTVRDFYSALKAAAKILRSGRSVYINPEGLRSPDGKILPFRPGVGMLALETGVPVVPVYLRDTWKALPSGSVVLRPRPVSVRFGKPFRLDHLKGKLASSPAYDIYKEAADEIRKKVVELSVIDFAVGK